MSNKAVNAVMFVAGFAIGAVAAWNAAKQKYELIRQEEADSYREALANIRKTEQSEPAELPAPQEGDNKDEDVDSMSVQEYAKKLAEEGYINYGDTVVSPDEQLVDRGDDYEPTVDPYIISPDQFGEMEDYEQTTLLYFEDHVLADSETLVELTNEEIDGWVGSEALNHFGEYEEDSVMVRNERLKTDFEILSDPRFYSKVSAGRAMRVEV